MPQITVEYSADLSAAFDRHAFALCTDPSQVGLAASTSSYRLWVVSWS